jgi:hypothetical protein
MDKYNRLALVLEKHLTVPVSPSLINEIGNIFLPEEEYFTKNEVDFIYCIGVMNTSGMGGLHKELQRLKEIGKDPSDIILALRKQE